MVKLLREQVDFPIAFSLGKKIGTGRWHVGTESFVAPEVCDKFSDLFDSKAYPDLIAFHEKEIDKKLPVG